MALNKRTLLYGGAIALLVVLFLVLRSGSASAQTVTTQGGMSDAELQAQTQIELAQISAGAQAAQTNAQLQLGAQQIQGDLDKASLEADLAKYQIDATTNAQNTQTQAQLQISEDTLTEQAQQAKYNADLQASVTKYTLDNALATQQANNNFQLDYAEAANQTQVALNTIQANVVTQQLAANRDVTEAQIAANQAALASQLGAETQIVQSNNDTQVSIANINAGVQKKQSKNNLIGGIVGGILSIF